MPFKVSARAHEGHVIVSGLSAIEPLTVADAIELGHSIINAASHVQQVQARRRGAPAPALETVPSYEAVPGTDPAVLEAHDAQTDAPPSSLPIDVRRRGGGAHVAGTGRRHQPNIQHGSAPTNETGAVREFTSTTGEHR